jgi:Reverse transcriptase (RNA-dependent DNA polymerase)
VYVNDIIITGNNQIKIDCEKRDIKQRYEIKDLCKLKFFLRIEMTHSHKGIFIFERKYILNLLKKIDKLGCKPAKTPIETNIKLNTEIVEPLRNINHFQ